MAARTTDGTAGTGRPVETYDRDDESRRRKGGWLWWLLALLALVLLGLLLYFGLRDGGDETGSDGNAAAQQQAGNDADGGGGSGSGANSGAGAGTLASAGGQELLPVPAMNELSRLRHERVTGTSVPVESVVADEAFWVGTSEQDRMLVRLERATESPFKVRAGEIVSFDGVLARAGDGLAKELGVTENEGAPLLAEQGVYVDVKSGDIRSG